MRFKEVVSLWLRTSMSAWRDLNRTERYCVVGVTLSLFLIVVAFVNR